MTMENLKDMKKTWEVHFCEGSYIMCKESNSECAIIDNTFTEHLGNIDCTQDDIEIIATLCQNAYNMGKLFPLDENSEYR